MLLNCGCRGFFPIVQEWGKSSNCSLCGDVLVSSRTVLCMSFCLTIAGLFDLAEPLGDADHWDWADGDGVCTGKR